MEIKNATIFSVPSSVKCVFIYVVQRWKEFLEIFLSDILRGTIFSKHSFCRRMFKKEANFVLFQNNLSLYYYISNNSQPLQGTTISTQLISYALMSSNYLNILQNFLTTLPITNFLHHSTSPTTITHALLLVSRSEDRR